MIKSNSQSAADPETTKIFQYFIVKPCSLSLTGVFHDEKPHSARSHPVINYLLYCGSQKQYLLTTVPNRTSPSTKQITNMSENRALEDKEIH